MQDERSAGASNDTNLLNHILIDMRLLDLSLLEALTNQTLERKSTSPERVGMTFEDLVYSYRLERKKLIMKLADEIRSGNVEEEAGGVLLSRILELPEFQEERQRGNVQIVI